MFTKKSNVITWIGVSFLIAPLTHYYQISIGMVIYVSMVIGVISALVNTYHD